MNWLKRTLLVGALWLGYAVGALAATCAGPFGGACTITNVSAVALVVPTQAVYLVIDNESASSAIACAFSNGTAGINTAGSYTVAAGLTRVWTMPRAGLLGAGNLNCVSASATSPATIEVH